MNNESTGAIAIENGKLTIELTIILIQGYKQTRKLFIVSQTK